MLCVSNHIVLVSLIAFAEVIIWPTLISQFKRLLLLCVELSTDICIYATLANCTTESIFLIFLTRVNKPRTGASEEEFGLNPPTTH